MLIRHAPGPETVCTSAMRFCPSNHYNHIVEPLWCDIQGGYIYSRLSSPTCNAVEAAVNQLEGGAGTLVFSSGIAAISSVLTTFLKTGDHMVSTMSRFHPKSCGCEHALSSRKPEAGVNAVVGLYQYSPININYSSDF